jgi:RNA polymerase sigma-70 factor (ECF subfamily)
VRATVRYRHVKRSVLGLEVLDVAITDAAELAAFVQHFGGCGKGMRVGSAIDSGEPPSTRVVVDSGVFRTMYLQHAESLFGYLASRVGRDLAEDLLAQTFQVAIESYGSFDPARGDVRGWLFGIGSNLLRHHWRTEQRRLRALAREAARQTRRIDPLVAVDAEVANRVDAVRLADRLVDALGALDPDDRTLLFLSGWERMTSSELSAALGVPAATIRSRLRRLRAHLRTVADLDPTSDRGETDQ